MGRRPSYSSSSHSSSPSSPPNSRVARTLPNSEESFAEWFYCSGQKANSIFLILGSKNLSFL